MEQSVDLFISFFTAPNIALSLFLIGIGISVLFGAIWLAGFLPPFMSKPWLWVVLVGSAIFTVFCFAFIQVPLQKLVGVLLQEFWSTDFMTRNILITGLPALLITGLVQEGAKLVPVLAYWWRKNRTIDPKLGMLIGAVAGAGFGIMESQWVINSAFTIGWNWQLVQTQGFMALLPFIERFFAIAFHIAVTAFAGYGLARGFGWQYYLLASLFHIILNYSVLLLNVKIFNVIQIEVFIAIWSLLITALVLWLRWRKPDKEKSGKITSYWNKKTEKIDKLVK